MRPTPPPEGSPRHHPLGVLLGIDVQRGAYGTGRSAWLARALTAPLWHLGPAEMRLLLDHGYVHPELLAVVIERLEAEPLTAVDGEAGGLIAAAIRVEPATWAEGGVAPDRVADCAASALAALRAWGGEPAWLAEDLALAIAWFAGPPVD